MMLKLLIKALKKLSVKYLWLSIYYFPNIEQLFGVLLFTYATKFFDFQKNNTNIKQNVVNYL